MKQYRDLLLIGVFLVACSVVIFAIQYRGFHDWHTMLFYLLQDLAFLPIQVLLVAVVIERVIARREKDRLLQKMNMVIGTFFSELGTKLLGLTTEFVANRADLRPSLDVRLEWAGGDWKKALAAVARFDYLVSVAGPDLAATRQLLTGSRELLTLLLANPNLMEHERFTDLLWAVSHLMEELAARPTLDGLPARDRKHLANDVRRVYGLLTTEWLLYCRHLQAAYPYIFSIVVRTHPLQDHPSAVVE